VTLSNTLPEYNPKSTIVSPLHARDAIGYDGFTVWTEDVQIEEDMGSRDEAHISTCVGVSALERRADEPFFVAMVLEERC
jgi:hypothetical protein